ncbi:head-tail connector protein [Streptomyces sp. NBC_01262]|uniref:head-tail connector protein n=1 Tax=Streptomyces sp. NBC_01262 TaxID=2903803 RepID=UPI002E340F1D|nr:head-tail connector protein [Streptomyces sp. NBC_01262]
MSFDLGENVRLEAECRAPGGTLTTATTAVLTITRPDGTTATPTVPDPGETGKYRVDYVPVQAGRHSVRWLFTSPASAYTDSFDVREAVPPMLVSLADMKAHMRITSTSTDGELRGWIESATEGVENYAGVCVRRLVVERQDIPPFGVCTVMLRQIPVLSVTSVVPIRSGGTTYDVDDLDVDQPTGVIERLDGGRIFGPLRITYTAGRTIVPSAHRDATKVIVQHLWRTKYGASRAASGLGGGEDFSVTEQVPGFGYAVPNRALQLLEPYKLPPGMA